MTIALVAAVCAALLLLVPNYTLERRTALRHAVAVRRMERRALGRRRTEYDSYDRS